MDASLQPATGANDHSFSNDVAFKSALDIDLEAIADLADDAGTFANDTKLSNSR